MPAHSLTSKNLCLLHGWGFDKSVMLPLERVLSQYYEVRSINIPGLTGRGTETVRIKDLAEPVKPLIEDAEVLVAWSLGGNVAIELASEKLPRLKAMILICCNPSFVMRPHWGCGLDSGSLVGLRATLQEDRGRAMREFAGWCAMGDLSVKQSHQTLTDHMNSAAVPDECLDNGIRILQQIDQRIMLAGIDCPVLMLFAANDRLVPVEVAEYAISLSENIQIQVIENCGHALPVSMPGNTADAIRLFLERL